MSNKLKQFKKKPQKIKFNGDAPTVSMPDMYTLNRQLMVKEPPLTLEQIEDNKNGLYLAGYIQPGKDYILLCRERYDFTAFRCHKVLNCINELFEVLASRGSIISVDKQENGTYECWIKDDDEAVLYMFFQADWIIDC